MPRSTSFTHTLTRSVAVALAILGFALGVARPASASPTEDPFSTAPLWHDPSWPPANGNDSALSRLTRNPVSVWVTGWSNMWDTVHGPVQSASSQGQVPVFVAYNIPNRDCGGYSAGGAGDPGSYASWISQFSDAIGSARAAVVLEPDALTSLDCMNSDQKQQRLQMLSSAVETFSARNSNTAVYIDAGHPTWKSASEVASLLKSAGIDKARGFALNVSSFYTTAGNDGYGEAISERVGGKHFVVDTSRNGAGPSGEWCNPWGRKLGNDPTSHTNTAHADAYLWIKRPGESDGYCNGGPAAGQWFSSYAYSLVS